MSRPFSLVGQGLARGEHAADGNELWTTTRTDSRDDQIDKVTNEGWYIRLST